VVNRQAGGRLNGQERGFDTGGGFRGQYEPHVQRMFTPVVVGDLRKGVNLFADTLVAFFGNRHGRETEGAAQALDLEHRAEAGEQTVGEQALDPPDQFAFSEAKRFGDSVKGSFADREAALHGVDDAPIKVGKLLIAIGLAVITAAALLEAAAAE